jgi:hypothetical protein
MRRVAVALLAIPLVLGTARLGWMVVAEGVGVVAEDRVPLNIAEAAGLENASEVVRRMRLGEDPVRVLPVRPHVISSSVPLASAIEAAVWSRQVELLELFDREGAAIDERSRAELACLAADISADDLWEYLTMDRAVTCEKDAALKRIQARAKAQPTS